MNYSHYQYFSVLVTCCIGVGLKEKYGIIDISELYEFYQIKTIFYTKGSTINYG